jgi:hypothetical protein
MRRFIITDKTGKLFLPVPPTGRGHSYSEFTDSTTECPRIFHSRGAAQKALGCWLRGQHYTSRDYEGDIQGIEIVPVPSRAAFEPRAEEIIIVPRSEYALLASRAIDAMQPSTPPEAPGQKSRADNSTGRILWQDGQHVPFPD